jgi:hypothetical protein
MQCFKQIALWTRQQSNIFPVIITFYSPFRCEEQLCKKRASNGRVRDEWRHHLYMTLAIKSIYTVNGLDLTSLNLAYDSVCIPWRNDKEHLYLNLVKIISF